ncbi:MAG: hypothetical protein WC319_10540 [Candidatus Paceibacterota bacterium]|jgi:hypothetical protein
MSEQDILGLFEHYLELRGYSSRTPSGHPSTTYDYAHSRIPFVLRNEGISIQTLITSTDKYVTYYNVGGLKAYLGAKSHNAVINAIKRFKEFLNDVQF